MNKKTLHFILFFYFTALLSTESELKDLLKQYKVAMKRIQTAIAVTKLDIGRNQSTKDLPDRYLKLGNLYIEKAKYLLYIEEEENSIDNTNEVDLSFVNESRRQALSVFEIIVNNFKDYKGRDRVLILMANEYQMLDDKRAMIETFEKLLREYPKSKFKNEGNLVLGNHYYDSNEIKKAKGYYLKIINDKPSPLQDVARYKLAWCYINYENYKKALELFEKVLKSTHDATSESQFMQKSIDVKTEALVDSVLAYTNIKERKAKDASSYYFKLAPSRGLYLKVLDKLANRYFTGGEFTNSVIIYRKLIQISNNVNKNLLYISRIWKLLRHLKGGEKEAGEEAKFLNKHLVRYKNSWRMPRKDLKKFIVDYEMYMRHVATKADKYYRKKNKNRKIGEQVTDAYKNYLNSFPKNKRSILMRRNYSGVLYDQKYYYDAGRVFEDMSFDEASPKKRRNALRTSLYCYNEILKKDKGTLYEKAWARAGIKDLSLRYLKHYPNTKKAPTIRFNVARLTFEQGKIEEGIDMLWDYMKKYPKSSHVSDAGNKILDYYNMKSDYEELVEVGKKILEIPGITDSKFKTQVKLIISSASKAQMYEQAEELMTAETEDEFFNVAKKYKGTKIGAESLFNAFQVARKKNNHYLVLESAEHLKKSYPNHKHIKLIYKVLPDIYLQNLQFDRACKSIISLYEKYPNEKGTLKLYQTAGDIYSILADYDKANEIYLKLMKKKASNDTIYLEKIGDNNYNDEAYNDALKHYVMLNSRINNMRTNYKIAKTHRKLGNIASMNRYYSATLKKCGRACQRNQELRGYAAESLFYLIDDDFKDFMRKRINNRDLEKSVATTTNEFANLEKAYSNIVNYQDPNWAVASLFRIGHLYRKMSELLKSARAPKGYNKSQRNEFKKLMNIKVKNLQKESSVFFTSCRKKSHDLNLFTPYSQACAEVTLDSSYRVKEKEHPSKKRRQFRGRDIHAKLLKKPNDLNLMQDLVEIYFNAGEYHTSKAISLKILEMKNDNDVRTILANSYFELNEHQLSYEIIKKVLQSDSNHKGAKNSLKRLYRLYKNPKYRNL